MPEGRPPRARRFAAARRRDRARRSPASTGAGAAPRVPPSRPARACRCALLLALAWTAAAGPARAGGPQAGPIPPALSAPRIDELRARLSAELPGIVERWTAIAGIPAPPGKEENRAARIEAEFRALGLEEIRRDEIGNVMGVLRGGAPSPRRVVYAAHLDTVAAEGDPCRIVRTDPDHLRGPGVRDNASGLIGLIEAARALKAMKVSPPGDIWLLATAQEEIGLFGARKFLDDHAGQVARFVAVDGELGEVSHGATGIVWLKVHFLAEGGHTLQSAAAPSAVRAAARAIDAIYDIGVPASPEQRASWLSVSTIGGGDAVNAMARDAWFTVDLRSNSPKLLEKLEADVRAAAGLAARRTRVGVAIEELLRMPGASLPGHEGSAFVRLALECQAAAGWPSPRASLLGTADHNRALERGIPGISVGVTTGAAIHTPQESASIQALPTGIAALALLMASLPSEP